MNLDNQQRYDQIAKEMPEATDERILAEMDRRNTMTDTAQADDGLVQARAEYDRRTASNDITNTHENAVFASCRYIAALEAHAAVSMRERDAAVAALNIALTALDHDLAFFSIDNATALQRDRVKSALQGIYMLLGVTASPSPSDSGDANGDAG